jgi:formate C-acetyltransferase
LYSLNGGRDELTGKQVAPKWPALKSGADANTPLNYEEVATAFYDATLPWLADLYAKAMNIIHAQHDKFNYEGAQLSLMDTHLRRLIAFGVSGFSVVADSLSAIKHARVYPERDPQTGITTGFRVEGDFPKYGNDDDRVDSLAVEVLERFYGELKKQHTYRSAIPTLSVLTITSNVAYGKSTGATPDGRAKGIPFAPGANPLHGRDASGALASLASVAKLPYAPTCLDGISNTFSLVTGGLGRGGEAERAQNLVRVLDGYFQSGGMHLNVNVLSRETLLDAMEHPERYGSLTIRVSGYAVRFVTLSREQQLEVISRTMFEDVA